MIIVLEDKKGFRKNIDVPRFPPYYDLPLRPDISVAITMNTEVTNKVETRVLRFYPIKDIKYFGWEDIMLYKEI